MRRSKKRQQARLLAEFNAFYLANRPSSTEAIVFDAATGKITMMPESEAEALVRSKHEREFDWPNLEEGQIRAIYLNGSETNVGSFCPDKAASGLDTSRGS